MNKKDHSRREFIKLNSLSALGTVLTTGLLNGCATSKIQSQDNTIKRSYIKNQKQRIDEYDPTNPKLCHRFKAFWKEDEMLFLKQIGVRWVRLEFSPGEGSYEHILSIQKKLAKYEIQIYSGTHSSYISERVGLGLTGRDKDIES